MYCVGDTGAPVIDEAYGDTDTINSSVNYILSDSAGPDEMRTATVCSSSTLP